MTHQEFINWLKDEVTLNGALAVNLPDKQYEHILERELQTMYEINPDAQ